jgi:hypothetical protein
MEACSQCPHPNDCLNVGACLNDLNAPLIASGQFPRRMTPAQANEFMEALRAGRTLRRISGGGKFGPAIASPKKFHTHCKLYPEWGAEAKRLAIANAKAADVLKGSTKRSRTHCGRGHPFAVHGLAYKNHVNGRRYRYCKLCNRINSQQGGKLSDSIVEKIKSLVRAGNPLRSFTSGGKPGYLARFNSVKLLRLKDAEFDRLVRLNSERKIITTNIRMPTLTGRIAAQPDETFSVVDAAVSRCLPHHIRGDVMGRLILDILEGRVDISEVAIYARQNIGAEPPGVFFIERSHRERLINIILEPSPFPTSLLLRIADEIRRSESRLSTYRLARGLRRVSSALLTFLRRVRASA